jgi:peptidoglycan/LPS O-acetylase OafA/YrhL
MVEPTFLMGPSLARGQGGFATMPTRQSGSARQVIRPDNGTSEKKQASTSSLALNNLRGLVILTVLAFHSVMAYLASLHASGFPFDGPSYEWRAFPIVDSHRWLGFDIFCAWQDVYLMSLMFFLSALFTWPSLRRKGMWRFLGDRCLRLGVPFAVALVIVMPVALYPVYRETALDRGLIAYARHYLALPFLPDGPMWFLWLLLALTVLAAGLYRATPRLIDRLGTYSASARSRPGRYFVCLAAASALAYVPLALVFTPWSWSNHGPFALQLSRPLLYAVMYCAGLAVGARGLERGLLAPEGMLVRRWAIWLGGATSGFLLWMGLTAFAMTYTPSAPLGLQVVVDASFAVACVSGCFAALAGCLRFATLRSQILASLANNAFGIYLLHYPFVVWLQYALLGVTLFAIAKAAIVFASTLMLAWALTVALRFIPMGARLIGADQLVLRGHSSSPASLATKLAVNLVADHRYEAVSRSHAPPQLARQQT